MKPRQIDFLLPLLLLSAFMGTACQNNALAAILLPIFIGLPGPSGIWTVAFLLWLGAPPTAFSGEPPQILAQPTSQEAGIGETITFSVVATGTPPLYYEWTHGQYSPYPILGTESSYSFIPFPSSSFFQVRSYQVAVRNAYGRVESDLVYPELRPPPQSGPRTLSISPIGHQSIILGQPAPEVTFNISDGEEPAENLFVSINSSNTELVPNQGLIVDRTLNLVRLLIVPTEGRLGRSVLSVSVRSNDEREAFSRFIFTVVEPGGIPHVADISDVKAAPGETVTIPLFFPNYDRSVSDLTVDVTSSDPIFLPKENIRFNESDINPQLQISTPPGKEGLTIIRFSASGPAGFQHTQEFTVTVATNSAPTLEPIPDLFISPGSVSSTIQLDIFDRETPISDLRIRASSSNAELLPDHLILFSNAGRQPSFIIFTAPGKTGTATVEIRVIDADGATTFRNFQVSIKSANKPPTITSVQNLVTRVNKAPPPVSVELADADGAAEALQIEVFSDNSALVPTKNIRITGTGRQRILRIEPIANKIGSARITLRVIDAAGASTETSLQFTVESAPAAKPDFDGDGFPDLVVLNAAGEVQAWPFSAQPSGKATSLGSTSDPAWKVAAIADMDHDGKMDLIWQHDDGAIGVWLMDGAIARSTQLLNPSSGDDRAWSVVAAGDVNGDASDDLIWQHRDGAIAFWTPNDNALSSASLFSPSSPLDPHWRLAGAGDFNRDGKTDLLWQHKNGTLAAWFMNRATLETAAFIEPNHPGDNRWRVAGVADFNSDGSPDLLFQHQDGAIGAWLMNGISAVKATLVGLPKTLGETWQVVGPK